MQNFDAIIGEILIECKKYFAWKNSHKMFGKLSPAACSIKLSSSPYRIEAKKEPTLEEHWVKDCGNAGEWKTL